MEVLRRCIVWRRSTPRFIKGRFDDVRLHTVPSPLPRTFTRPWLHLDAQGYGVVHWSLWKNATLIVREAFIRYRSLSKVHPYSTAFVACFSKGALASIVTQSILERRKQLDCRRVLAMALFSGTFTGCAYHSIFNVMFTRIFGTSSGLSIVSMKVAADGVIIFPFLYMPTFYMFDEVVRRGSFTGICVRWREETAGAIREYVKVWPVTMLCVFTVIPIELRVTFIAAVSFTWLVILSFLAPGQME